MRCLLAASVAVLAAVVTLLPSDQAPGAVGQVAVTVRAGSAAVSTSPVAEADRVTPAVASASRPSATPAESSAPSSGAAVGFPWGWAAVVAALAAGMLAWLSFLRPGRGSGSERTAAVSIYGKTRTLVDATHATLTRADSATAGSWAHLDEDVGEILSDLHIAGLHPSQGAVLPKLQALMGVLGTLSRVLGVAAETAREQRQLGSVIDDLRHRLTEVEIALRHLKAVL
ncbi:MAG: hypothetical protein ACJ74U_02530 [Jatrophihabitantaceae bacterium]